MQDTVLRCIIDDASFLRVRCFASLCDTCSMRVGRCFGSYISVADCDASWDDDAGMMDVTLFDSTEVLMS